MLVYFYFFLIATSLIILGIAGVEFLNALNRFRGPRVVTCPADGRNVGIQIDAKRAASLDVRGRREDYHVMHCSSWPEREGCAQGCTKQLEGDPDETLLRPKLEEYYSSHACALCGGSIRSLPPDRRGPGFLAENQKKIGWDELPLDEFPAALARHAPLCAHCRFSAEA
jgi:hypothetical protein